MQWRVKSGEIWEAEEGALPVFFVNVASKGVAGENSVSVASKGVISPLSATFMGGLVGVASKGVTGAFCLQEGKQSRSVASKGFRGTAWREAMFDRARKKSCQPNKSIIPYCQGMSIIIYGVESKGFKGKEG